MGGWKYGCRYGRVGELRVDVAVGRRATGDRTTVMAKETEVADDQLGVKGSGANEADN